LQTRRKGDKERIAIAEKLRQETTMTYQWIAQRLAPKAFGAGDGQIRARIESAGRPPRQTMTKSCKSIKVWDRPLSGIDSLLSKLADFGTRNSEYRADFACDFAFLK
jgi:hypothetical protein